MKLYIFYKYIGVNTWVKKKKTTAMRNNREKTLMSDVVIYSYIERGKTVETLFNLK